MLKETSVFSAISLIDMMFVTKDLIGLYYKTEESLFMLVVGYLIILLPLSLFGVWLERKLKYVGYSNWFIIKGNKFRKTSLWFMDNNKIKFNFCNFISNFWNTFWAFYGNKKSYNKNNFTKQIYVYVSRGSYGIAAAMSTILTLMTVISLLVFMRVSKNKNVMM